ncbi:unnamed protein product [Paramecium primaurelia]|uniref:B box-type domain-containing protein n=1 Tax=Paramecium primaurelia TaxID=5886 RepID=A0A8S1KEU6_PARPR|nr:unnamed protein product [Paramecium primaurelia]
MQQKYCDECEETRAKINCNQCGQILCEQCDKKIHNKGKRVYHSRELIETSDSIESNKIKQDAHVLRHEQHKERFKQINSNLPSVDVVNFNLINIQTETPMIFQNDSILAKIEHHLFKQANKGDLMIHLNDFQKFLKQNEIYKINQSKDIIQQLEKLKMINVTIRKFGDSDPIQFISLQLDHISLQSLYWVLLNIRKDEMTPTDKLVMSRIKECYGLKLNIQDWNHYLAGFYKLQDSNGLIQFNVKKYNKNKWIDEKCIIKMTKCPIDLVNKSENNNASLSASQQINNESLLLFTIEDNINWKMMDAQQMSSIYKCQWRSFIQFLKDFFDTNLTLNTSQNTQSFGDLNQSDYQSQSSKQSGTQSVPTQKNQDNSKWIRSVESGLQNGQKSLEQYHNQSYSSNVTQKKRSKKSQIKPPKSIQKAIPGGKYGCAQLLKCCGPLELRVCSLGVLCLMIQEAINRNVLIYYKTLLIKPNTNIAFDFNDFLNIFDDQFQDQFILQNILGNEENQQLSIDKQQQQHEKQNKLKAVQQAIIDILNEYTKGVSLARLPKMIQRKIQFTFDLHELGFTKLKCLIQGIDGISIINDGTTYASLILDEYYDDTNDIKQEQEDDQQMQQVKIDLKYFQKQSLQQQQSSSNPQLQQQQIQQQQQQQQQQLQFLPPIHVSEYQLKIEQALKQILNQYTNGIPAFQLLQILQLHIQNTFEYTQFGCSTFEEYMVKYAENYSDVMIKMKGCIIYPKGYSSFRSSIPQQKMQLGIHHQKSQSTTLPSYAQQQSNSSSQIIKADSFLAGMQNPSQMIGDVQSQSLTFQSFQTYPQNKDFFMIQEENSHHELDANVRFIEELLKESDDVEQKKHKVQRSHQTHQDSKQFQSLGQWPTLNSNEKRCHNKYNTYQYSPQQDYYQGQKVSLDLHSWDQDN